MASKSYVLLRSVLGRNTTGFSSFHHRIGSATCLVKRGKSSCSLYSSCGGKSSLKWRLLNTGRHLCCTSSASQLPEESRKNEPSIISAVCVERLPCVTPDKTDLEMRFEELQNQLELEHSVLSDDELEALKLDQRRKRLKEDDDEESMEIAKEESQKKEFEEAEEEALKKFDAGSRTTQADKNKDRKSLDRKLQENLVLLVKREKPEPCWEMPCGQITGTETLRQAAQRRLNETCGQSLAAQFLSNAPNAVYKKSKNREKVFFFKAQYKTGDIELSGEYSDHVWVTKEEMETYVDPDFYKVVKRFVY